MSNQATTAPRLPVPEGRFEAVDCILPTAHQDPITAVTLGRHLVSALDPDGEHERAEHRRHRAGPVSDDPVQAGWDAWENLPLWKRAVRRPGAARQWADNHSAYLLAASRMRAAKEKLGLQDHRGRRRAP